MPKGTVPNVLAAQCALRCVGCVHIKPCCLVANCCSEDVCAIAQEEHLSALNLDSEAMGSDKMQDSQEVALGHRDIKYTGQTHGIGRPIERLHNYQADAPAVNNGIVCNAYGNNMRLEGLEPATLGAHMRCSTQVCNPVHISVCVVCASKMDTCTCSRLLDSGGTGQGGDLGRQHRSLGQRGDGRGQHQSNSSAISTTVLLASLALLLALLGAHLRSLLGALLSKAGLLLVTAGEAELALVVQGGRCRA
jgi:hypothetical protein